MNLGVLRNVVIFTKMKSFQHECFLGSVA